MWKGLEQAFSDSGVSRKVSILSQLVRIRLRDVTEVEKYINDIISLWNKTKVAGLLGGLPEEYTSMIFGVENSGHELTIDFLKTILLQGILCMGINLREERIMVARYWMRTIIL